MLYLHLLSEPLDGPHRLFPVTYSANRADMHCLGVVARVKQAISLQQHREACLEEVAREKTSVSHTAGHPGMGPRLSVRQ